jgi:hypothetical protein
MNELHQLLTDCREKLQFYSDRHDGDCGELELRGRIDAALAKPLHCATCQCNKLDEPVPAPGNPLSRSWHDNAEHGAPKT